MLGTGRSGIFVDKHYEWQGISVLMLVKTRVEKCGLRSNRIQDPNQWKCVCERWKLMLVHCYSCSWRRLPCTHGWDGLPFPCKWLPFWVSGGTNSEGKRILKGVSKFLVMVTYKFGICASQWCDWIVYSERFDLRYISIWHIEHVKACWHDVCVLTWAHQKVDHMRVSEQCCTVFYVFHVLQMCGVDEGRSWHDPTWWRATCVVWRCLLSLTCSPIEVLIGEGVYLQYVDISAIWMQE